MHAARYWIAGFASAALLVLGLASAGAEDAVAPAKDAGTRHHALSLVGEPRFPADFKNFDWVNPDAPKGGTLRMFGFGSFDSLNPFSVQGDAAGEVSFIYESLMESSPDEPATEYGLIAEWVTYPADYSSATFGLRPEARFQDGMAITPEDVVFSLDALKKANPRFAAYYKNVVKAEKTGEHEVTFTFDKAGNRELPQIVGELTILPKHFWEAKGANGEPRDLAKSTLEVPLGSGPYKVKSIEASRGVVLERVKDYWGKDLPIMRGQYNYDEIRFTYYRDQLPAFEAFKAGQVDVWPESSATRWATQYAFDAVTSGAIKKNAFPVTRPGVMQAFAFNLRRDKFKDPRVRRAFNLVLDFEQMNKTLFYGMYERVGSYFGKTELASHGLPEGRELEILNEVKDQVAAEVFATEWKNPVNVAPQDRRRNLSEAAKLFADAGWTVKNGVLTNAAGEPFSVEFLLSDPQFERVVLPFINELKKIGVSASVRIVDSSQYERRERSRDFDIVVESFGQSFSPGNEQRDYWGSAAADIEGSRNTLGIKNPAIDKIIDKIVFAKDRAELVAASRALDRVLLWNHYVVPQWGYPYERLAYWDKFGHPEKVPMLGVSYLRAWWLDPAKQQAASGSQGK
ncbi:MAG: extracellular solute-binding protein [Hyphomicrobium sp.]|jgi:microcin C transport system substrate-binding protein